MLKLDRKKILIVGAGLAGCTIARTLAENHIEVVIIDKRSHVAGNTFDFVNKNNERIHKYGPHLLHCRKDSESLKFLSRFTKWIKYEHKVRALLENGKTTPIPVNKTTLEDVFKRVFKNENEILEFLENIRKKDLIPTNTDEFFEASVGEELANIFFRPYTKKMWGIEPKELNISIGERIRVKTNNDDRYFNDEFQALPEAGYTAMVNRILDHKNIQIHLNTPFVKGMEENYLHSFLSIPIDEYFNFKFGKLPYRSIIFEERLENGIDLEVPVINFTDNSPYTRKTQWNLFPNSDRFSGINKTLTYEKPCSMESNPGEYYYPVQTKESGIIFSNYKKLAKKNFFITFIGRAGLFKYIDMIPAVQIHMSIANNFLKKLL
tara:strand:- start:175 stop:1308 length:1134 start_codon:yes stop_codon:yes gene_type:complete